MTIEEDGGRAWLAGMLTEYHGPTCGRDDLCLQVQALHDGGYVLGDICDACAVGTDAGVAQVVDQAGEKFFPVVVDVGKDVGEVRVKFWVHFTALSAF